MAADLITPDTASLEGLREIFDSALYKVALEGDSLRIASQYEFLVLLTQSKQHARFLAVLSLPDGPDLNRRFAIANRVNDHLIFIRAAVSGDKHDRLILDHYVCLDGGITPKAVAFTFKHFERLVEEAVKEVRAALEEAATADKQAAIEKQLRSSFPESRSTSDKAMLSSGRG